MKHPLLDPDAQLVIGHRGNAAHAPENTIESLRQAVECGADAVEFDVRVTRDGVAVLLHDPTLERTTNGNGRLAEVDFAELRALDAGRGKAGWSGPRVDVPRLEDVLDQFRRTMLVIEVKEPRAVEPTVQFVHRLGLQASVVVGSGDPAVMTALYRSGLRTIASTLDAARVIPLALMGATPRAVDYSVLSVTPLYYGLPIPVLRMAAAVRKQGIPTHVWTINDPVAAVAYWKGGVAGIVTDDPAALLRVKPK